MLIRYTRAKIWCARSDERRGTDNFRGVASGCPLFRGKNVRESAVGDAKSVRCSEFRGGRFSEVANVLHKRDFQSVSAALSAVGSVSASRSVRSGRFYCSSSYHTDIDEHDNFRWDSEWSHFLFQCPASQPNHISTISYISCHHSDCILECFYSMAEPGCRHSHVFL